MIDPTEKQKAILAQNDHLLVTGGPGSGKTTIAILKAGKILKPSSGPANQFCF